MKLLASEKRWLILITCYHALWFLGAACWRHIYNGDSYEYFYLAQNLRHGFYYSGNPALPIKDIEVSLRMPFYTYFLSFIHLVFGSNNLIVLAFQNILSILNCWLVYHFFKSFFQFKKYGWIYWILIMAYPAQCLFANMIVPDIVLQLFLLLYVKNLLLYEKAKSEKHFWLMSLYLILAMAVKPIVYPLIILHCIYSIWQMLRLRKGQLFLAGIIPLLLILSFGFWNRERTGVYHISSVQPHNLIDYNIYNFHASKYGTEEANKMNLKSNTLINQEPSYAARYAKAEALAKDTIKANLASYSFFHLVKSLRYFIEPGKVELDLFTGYNTYFKLKDSSRSNFSKSLEHTGISGAWQYFLSYPYWPFILLIALINCLRFLGFLYFLFDRKKSFTLRLIIFLFVGYFAVITGPVSNYTRYFLPVLLFVSVCSAMGYGALWEQWLKPKLKNLHREHP